MSNENVRIGVTSDIDEIVKLSRQFPQELGFVRKVALNEAIDRNGLHVATLNAVVVGFVVFRKRLDGWHTIYDIAVSKTAQRKGIGSALFASVPLPIRLKCTTDNPANKFYEAMGCVLVQVEDGRKRPLNVWTANHRPLPYSLPQQHPISKNS